MFVVEVGISLCFILVSRPSTSEGKSLEPFSMYVFGPRVTPFLKTCQTASSLYKILHVEEGHYDGEDKMSLSRDHLSSSFVVCIRSRTNSATLEFRPVQTLHSRKKLWFLPLIRYLEAPV